MSSLKTIRVFFPLLDKNILVEAGITVAEACAQVGFPQNLVCGGKGTCKKCLVTIRENDLVSEVLGCQHLVSEDMSILISKEAAISQILEVSDNGELSFNPKTRVVTIPFAEFKTEMCSYDLETVRTILDLPVTMTSIKVLRKSSEVFHTKNNTFLNLFLYNNEIIDLLASNEKLKAYGVAFDIGTTSVVGYLYDLTTGVLIHQHSSLNKQISFGGDVISRIEYASASPENLKTIQHAIHETINDILSNLIYESKISSDAIYDCVFCGNSTMATLFLGLNPLHLGFSPFTGVSQDIVILNANELNININPFGKITFLPLLGGFVGADTTSVLLGLPKDDAYRLMIDLGTNGEIAIGNHNKYFVASTACGPALEGAGIHMGMRGTSGAIEKIAMVNDEIECHVIGNVPPIGFCGSGIIDAIAFLFREKIIYDRGNFVKGDDLDNHPLKDRFKTDEAGQRYFVFVKSEDNPNGKELIITQKDIRSVQLAKAAIFTGCCMLAEKFGIKGEDLKEIALAGAFGNYIDIENAQFIGLLPKIEGVPIRSIGNGAGTGAQLFLLSADEAKLCEAIPKRTTHIELASDPNFANIYMQNTTLGQNIMI
ncbi:ASKHA domain-containing protein [Acetobacterium woodii]|uniref:Corrinoid activation/regeneration protein n=1 Tax=Acetobacterium woodii (strain ATCC 29683 / DSM 1030 / JCM 2381 / KCTC 1655 / WB1) TaxID=931626 RepID=H6LBX3_ACEWD|nr:ASKHA domain-containing protein [Acetobacterium woodii]AFA47716.1 corrinoid activation/regeneration protein [Acetobacterium woodii DSM 1030]